jgi:hypothetical protein
MTEEQILEFVRFHFEVGGIRDDGSCSEYYGTTKDFIDFARAIYEIGNENGWEGRADAEYLNSSYPTGLVGDPQ